MWQIKKGTTNGRKWTEDDEAAFVSLLEAELDKVHTFQKV
jgi:SPX domain protein involved in polyphosphate accumulation